MKIGRLSTAQAVVFRRRIHENQTFFGVSGGSLLALLVISGVLAFSPGSAGDHYCLEEARFNG